MSVKNVMTVDSVVGGIKVKQFAVAGTTYCPSGDIVEIDENGEERVLVNGCLENRALQWMSMISSMCNEAKLTFNLVSGHIHWHITGEPTEGALKVLSEKLKIPTQKQPNGQQDITEIYNLADTYWHEQYSKELTLEFDRKRKSMSVVVVCSESNRRYLLVKGAPESLLERSNRIYTHDNDECKLEVAHRTRIDDIQHQYASQGLRCIGIAYKEIGEAIEVSADSDYAEIESGLVFVGITAMQDPPREEVRDAIVTCNKAGIRVIVITGDNIKTAEAVCREIGLFAPNEDLSGKSFLGLFKVYF